jgi:D-inositol-3-phosphate glycosyltransferase
MNKLRIVFSLQYYFPYIGGLENLFMHLAEGLVERGYHVHVVTTWLPNTPIHDVINGVQIERVVTPRVADRYFFTLMGLPAVLRASRDSQIVHTTPYLGVLPAYIGSKIARKPIVFTALEVLGSRWYSVEENILKAMFYKNIEKFIYHLPYTRLASISQATMDDISQAGIDICDGRVIHCGVDDSFSLGPSTGVLRCKLGLNPQDFIYVYFGRPGMTKGVDVLLRAAPLVQKAITSAHLVLILADNPRSQYESLCQLAKSLEKDARITLISSRPQSELIEYLRDANCVVIPSLTEGFGLTTAEACALGLPVVATTAGSIPEIISGKHVLVQPNSSEALAEGIIRISRGVWSETPVKSYTWSAMVDAYEQLYQELV